MDKTAYLIYKLLDEGVILKQRLKEWADDLSGRPLTDVERENLQTPMGKSAKQILDKLS